MNAHLCVRKHNSSAHTNDVAVCIDVMEVVTSVAEWTEGMSSETIELKVLENSHEVTNILTALQMVRAKFELHIRKYPGRKQVGRSREDFQLEILRHQSS